VTAATRRLTKAASLRPAGRGKENSKISAHGYGGLGAYPVLYVTGGGPDHRSRPTGPRELGCVRY
jgi:hypothetical protein